MTKFAHPLWTPSKILNMPLKEDYKTYLVYVTVSNIFWELFVTFAISVGHTGMINGEEF